VRTAERKRSELTVLKLGRKPARFTRASFARSHILARHLSDLGPAPPQSPDWVAAVMQQSPDGWTMLGNDAVGDCTIADCGHQEMLRTANVGAITIPTTEQVLTLYSAITGYNPSDPNSDQGADELTVAFVTGAGFKTVEAVAEALNPPLEIDANVESFEDSYRALQPAQGVA